MFTGFPILFFIIRILLEMPTKIPMVIVLKEKMEIGMTFHRLLTLFARAKGFLKGKHLTLILMRKMVNYVI